MFSKQSEKAPVWGWCGFLCSEFSHRHVGLRQHSQGSDCPRPFKCGVCREGISYLAFTSAAWNGSCEDKKGEVVLGHVISFTEDEKLWPLQRLSEWAVCVSQMAFHIFSALLIRSPVFPLCIIPQALRANNAVSLLYLPFCFSLILQ